jgi:hypothetical protein
VRAASLPAQDMSGQGAISAAHHQKMGRSVQILDRLRLQTWNTQAYLARSCHASRAVSGCVGRRPLFTSATSLSEIKPKHQHQHGRVRGRREERVSSPEVESVVSLKLTSKGFCPRCSKRQHHQAGRQRLSEKLRRY